MNQTVRAPLPPIPFIDVGAQRRRLGRAIDDAIARVTSHCQFINGPEVAQFETQLAAFCGAKYAVGCASGTDALLLVLMARGIGAGDAVICPAFTFCATAEVVVLAGATPVFADVDAETFNINANSVKRAVATAKRHGLKPKAVIAVDLFGLPADYDALSAVAKAEGLYVLDDAAQGFGATHQGRKLGTVAPATATSFFPAKPLGCYGDGGAVLTDDASLVEVLKSLRVHGQHGTDKYDNVRIGMTSRLDTIQAAVLIEKLKIFPDEIAARDAAARRYAEGLGDVAIVPAVPDGYTSVWAQYTIRVQAGRARRPCRGAQGPGHSNRGLLSEAIAPARGLPPLPGGGQRHSGDRSALGGGHQPADACLPGRADAGPGDRGGPGRAQAVN